MREGEGSKRFCLYDGDETKGLLRRRNGDEEKFWRISLYLGRERVCMKVHEDRRKG